MRKLLFALSILTNVLFFTSCGSQNQEAKQTANNQTVLEVPVTQPPLNFEGTPGWFKLTEAEDATDAVPRDGGDCFTGKGVWHEQRLISTITVTAGDKNYTAELRGISSWGTGKAVATCGDQDPDKERYNTAKKQYLALTAKDVTKNDLVVTIKDGKLTKIILKGKFLGGNLKKPDVTVQLASL